MKGLSEILEETDNDSTITITLHKAKEDNCDNCIFYECGCSGFVDCGNYIFKLISYERRDKNVYGEK